jgi:hypothetical protein
MNSAPGETDQLFFRRMRRVVDRDPLAGLNSRIIGA